MVSFNQNPCNILDEYIFDSIFPWLDIINIMSYSTGVNAVSRTAKSISSPTMTGFYPRDALSIAVLTNYSSFSFVHSIFALYAFVFQSES